MKMDMVGFKLSFAPWEEIFAEIKKWMKRTKVRSEEAIERGHDIHRRIEDAKEKLRLVYIRNGIYPHF